MHKHPAQPANSQPIDQQARRSAIDPHTSFAVAAPAGSGKTGLLTQRVLSLLAHAEHPEEVLSITFTRKAAAEMQERIISAIASAAATPQMPDDAHAAFTWKLAQQVIKRDKLKHWQLLQSPNRLRIQTIDGFCRSLARQLPLASGLGALPQTLDQPELAYAQAVLDLFEQMEGEADTFSHWQTVLAYLDNNLPRLQQLLQTLLAKRDQWLPNLHPIFSQTLLAKEQTPKNFNASALQAWIEEVLTDIDTKLTAHASELALLGDYAASNLGADAKTDLSALLGATGLPTTTSEGLASWQQLASLLTTASGWRKRLDKNIGFISPKEKHEKALATERKQALMAIIGELQQQPGLLEQLLLLKTLPSPDSTDKAQTIIASLSYLLVLLAAQLKVVFRKLGATDFIEVSQAALQALGEEDEPSQIALQLDYQIRHILVDEFQDTAGPQLRLLEKLTAGWEVGDGRTLFIVGDGMQSCYGFREANVGLFLQAREKGIGTVKLQALDLQVNFRSQAGVVNWVNQVFEHAFPARNDIGRGAVSYAHSVAFKAELQGPACQLKIFAQDPDFPNQQQAQVLAEQVAKLRAELPDDSVAILVRNRSHLATVLPALAAQGLSWQATDIDPLASRMVIQDLLNLTQALLYPSDRLALLSVLRSPLLGLDLKQLWSLSNWPDGETKPLAADGYKRPLLIEQLLQKQFASQLEKGQAKRLSHFCNHWCAAQQNYGRKPLRIWVEGLWLALGGPATLLEPAELNNVESFFDLLGAEGYILDSWQSFKEKVERLYARPDANADPKLQVMTIHKSKGLEFDHVFIPALERNPRSNSSELLMWLQRINHRGENDLLIAPLASRAFDTNNNEANSLYDLLRDEDKLKLDFEATRLLYVGCTRAIKHLHLYANLKIDPKKSGEQNLAAYEQLRPPGNSSLLAKIWPTIKREAQVYSPAEASGSTQATGPHPSRDFGLRLADNWRAASLNNGELLAAFRGREFGDADNNPEPFRSENTFHRHLGTVMHRALRQICIDGQGQWPAERRLAQTELWQQQLQQLGLWPDGARQGATLIEKAMALCLQDPIGRWLLNNQHDDSQCEWRLWHSQQGREYILDRSFIYRGQRWVIDYKSALPAAEQSEAEFIEQQWDSYGEQLANYQRLLSQLGPEPVQTALYFPLIQTLAPGPGSEMPSL